MPSYPGDMTECYMFIARQMHYPEEAEEKGIEGRVLIRFVVEKDGRLTNFEVIESPDPLLSNEALRVLKQMPKWIPAKNKGKDVRCRYSMPILFRLN
jgi:TonB family protein